MKWEIPFGLYEAKSLFFDCAAVTILCRSSRRLNANYINQGTKCL